MDKEIQELQKQSNAAIKRARVAAILPKELDDVLSMLNARIRNLENKCGHRQESQDNQDS